MFEHFQNTGEFLLGMGVFINALIGVLTYINTRQTSKDMKALETNTNSKLDQFVALTARAAHAEGVIVGHDQAVASAIQQDHTA